MPIVAISSSFDLFHSFNAHRLVEEVHVQAEPYFHPSPLAARMKSHSRLAQKLRHHRARAWS
jgi:hypothetical protein